MLLKRIELSSVLMGLNASNKGVRTFSRGSNNYFCGKVKLLGSL